MCQYIIIVPVGGEFDLETSFLMIDAVTIRNEPKKSLCEMKSLLRVSAAGVRWPLCFPRQRQSIVALVFKDTVQHKMVLKAYYALDLFHFTFLQLKSSLSPAIRCTLKH